MYKVILLCLICISQVSCSSIPASNYERVELVENFTCQDGHYDPGESPTSENHVVRINGNGVIIPQSLDGLGSIRRGLVDPLSTTEVQSMYRRLFCEAEALAKRKAAGKTEDVTVKMLVYVHGGLNAFGATDARIVEQHLPTHIVQEDYDWHYPIFVSWPSAATPTYFEQTFLVREGRRVNPFLGAATAPFMIVADLLRTVGNYPATAYYQMANEKDRLSSAYYSPWLSGIWKDSVNKFCDLESVNQSTQVPPECQNIIRSDGKYRLDANLSSYYSGSMERLRRGSGQTVTFPVRYTVGSLWHSGISNSAWKNMKRRTSNIFYPAHLFNGRVEKGVAGVSFFDMLLDRAAYIESRNSNMHYEITLVGHSMGTIVLNNALANNPRAWAQSGNLRNVVYMAAAASIDDTLDSLGPILDVATDAGNDIDFYNLTLNRVAEISETHAWGLVPLGSLLVSIDQHYESPEHPLRRTFGSEVNILSSLDVIDDRLGGSSGKLVFKAFDRCQHKAPQVHGDFGEIAFWREKTWQIDTAACGQRDALLYKELDY